MKIAYIIKSLAQPAGTERIMIDKINYLSERLKYDISIITYEQGNHKIVFPLSPQIKHIDLDTKFYLLRELKYAKAIYQFAKMRNKFNKKYKECINNIAPDIIVCTTYSGFLIDFIINKSTSSPVIIESHVSKSFIEYKEKWKGNFPKRFIGGLIDNYIEKKIGKCSALITLTQQDAQAWSKIKEAIVIPNCLSKYPIRIEKLNSKKQIISVGRLDYQKGYDILIDVWNMVKKRHPEWSLSIYGDGIEKNILTNKIKNYNLENVISINQPISDIYEKYMESDFYVMSSRWEGFGLVLIESMACGTPCISFNCPHGPSDIITDGEDGFLVENGNTAELYRKICFLIENEKIRLEMSRKSRENVKRYLPERIMPQWVHLFESLYFKTTN